jgi:Ca-activated chloride channel family protein
MTTMKSVPDLRAIVCSLMIAGGLLIAGCTSTEKASPAAPDAQTKVEQPASRPEASTATPPVAAAKPEPRRSDARALERSASQAQAMPRMLQYDSSRTYVPPSPVATYPGTDRFPDKEPTGITSVAEHPVSTFSVDVDTASYAFVRRYLTAGRMPPRDAVRVEEMVNYFPYSYPAPQDRSQPFRVTHAVMPSPWAAENQLLHIAIKGYDIARAERPRANVVLLIDTSGSMSPQDRLPLLQQGFRLFASQLRSDDRVAIVTYAGQAQTALEPTAGSEKQKIIEGLQRAYALAERHFDRNAVNRIILATDGDFNVGITNPKELEHFIAGKRKTGIYLSIFGVGLGNLNDALMQRLAQAGNGNAAYIDSLLEARKALSDELASTLFPIADDVKVQVEFNPNKVAAYRLVGYETRMLRREDFNNDTVDAGDIGAGHSVTALYEIIPVGAKHSVVDPLRYQTERRAPPTVTGNSDEYAFVKLRYKLPGESTSRLIEQPVRAAGIYSSLAAVPAEQRFAVAVAAFAQRIRGESAVDSLSYARIADLANAARGADPEGYRAEFVRLVRIAETMGAAHSAANP